MLRFTNLLKDRQPIRGRAEGPVAIEEMRTTEDPMRETLIRLSCSWAFPPSKGPDTDTLSDKHTEGKISLYCYINLTNKPNTV